MKQSQRVNHTKFNQKINNLMQKTYFESYFAICINKTKNSTNFMRPNTFHRAFDSHIICLKNASFKTNLNNFSSCYSANDWCNCSWRQNHLIAMPHSRFGCCHGVMVQKWRRNTAVQVQINVSSSLFLPFQITLQHFSISTFLPLSENSFFCFIYELVFFSPLLSPLHHSVVFLLMPLIKDL